MGFIFKMPYEATLGPETIPNEATNWDRVEMGAKTVLLFSSSLAFLLQANWRCVSQRKL